MGCEERPAPLAPGGYARGDGLGWSEMALIAGLAVVALLGVWALILRRSP